MAKSKFTDTEQGDVRESIARINLIMVGVIIVLLVGFAAAFIAVGGLIVNYEAERQSSYQQLELEVQRLNDKIK